MRTGQQVTGPCGDAWRRARRRADDPRLLSLPFLIAVHASGQSAAADAWQFGGRRIAAGDRVRLAYAGPPGSVPTLSMRQLLAADPLKDPAVQALRGKAVIVGASYGGMNDSHVTPYGRGVFDSPLMLGAEIQAQTVEALLGAGISDPARLAAATVEELTAIEGIGPKTAAKIIASAKAAVGAESAESQA